MQTVSQATRQPAPTALATARAPWFRLRPEDGFLTLVFVVLIVYATVLSIQTVSPPWAPGLSILTTTAGVGLILGYLAVEQGRLPHWLIHGVAVVLGALLAFQATANRLLAGNRPALLARLLAWLRDALLNNGHSDDDAVFLLFLGVLTMLLAYISVWLVMHARRPWLAIVANAVVLLINLGYATPDHYFYLLLFLLAALLLLVRFSLADHMRVWRQRGLRFSPDLGWDVMQIGTIFAVVVLLAAYVLPAGATDAGVVSALTSPQGAWTRLQTRLEELFGGVAGINGPGGAGYFGGTLRLQGTVNLPNSVILHYTVPSVTDDPAQYLITQTFDSYDGVNQWTQSATDEHAYPRKEVQPAPGSDFGTDTYFITIDAAPPTGDGFLFAPGSAAAAFSVANDAAVSHAAGSATAWTAQSALPQGASYAATGYVSQATEAQLRAVAYPAQLSGGALASQYPQGILDAYLPSNAAPISPLAAQLARQWTRGATTMYDAAVLIEDHLRTFTYSTQNPNPPANEDAVTWFLQRQEGFCTFFASAMAEMGRSLGMPTRIASGFASGAYNASTHTYLVRGTLAHTWTQIYFGRYGWINFEPTAGFAKFTRVVAESTGVSPTGSGPATPVTQPTQTSRSKQNLQSIGTTGRAGSGSGPVGEALLGLAVLLVLLLIVAGAVAAWWRALYQRLPVVEGVYARLTRLGAWAGAPPRRHQTPREYAEALGRVVPERRGALLRLSDIYARDRWGGGVSRETMAEVPWLYDLVRGTIAPVIARRLRRLPGRALRALRLPRRRPRRRSAVARPLP